MIFSGLSVGSGTGGCGALVEPMNTSRLGNKVMATVLNFIVLGISRLVARCTEALANVQRSQPVATPNNTRPSSAREELLTTLQGGSKKKSGREGKMHGNINLCV